MFKAETCGLESFSSFLPVLTVNSVCCRDSSRQTLMRKRRSTRGNSWSWRGRQVHFWNIYEFMFNSRFLRSRSDGYAPLFSLLVTNTTVKFHNNNLTENLTISISWISSVLQSYTIFPAPCIRKQIKFSVPDSFQQLKIRKAVGKVLEKQLPVPVSQYMWDLLMICDPASVSGSGSGGQKKGWTGEDQEPEEEVQAENPGEHWETETWTAQEETDEKKTDQKEKSRTGNGMKTDLHTVYNNLFSVQYVYHITDIISSYK